MHGSIVALAAAAAGALFFVGDTAADYYRQRLPDGVDNLMPRYYEYRSPRAFYIDEGPVAYRVYGYSAQPLATNQPPAYPPVGVVFPAPVYAPAPPGYAAPAHAPPVYAPSAYRPPVNAYTPPAPPPVQGYRVPPAVPGIAVRPQPICGVYRFWRDDRCIDARGD